MIALDTNVFIYLLNAHPEFGPRAIKVLHGPDEKCASELIWAEVFSSPKLEDAETRRKAQEFIGSLAVEFVPVGREAMMLAGQLRRKNKALKLAGALQLASALQAGADTFVTNDQDLLKAKVPGLAIKGL